MKVVIQRVSSASVEVNGEIVGKISAGVLVYLGVCKGDTLDDAQAIARKIAELRIFEDADGKMNLSIQETGGAVLLISNFTVAGNCRKGRRPSFDTAASPDLANQLYEKAAHAIEGYGIEVEMGLFQEHMHVESVNDGPVTFIVDTR